MAALILIGILFLVILILGHEFGHFLAAKLFGLRVDEFGIGFPPKVFSKRIHETRYSFNLLPFGGFVKIHGEHSSADEKLEEPERSFVHQPAWRRSVIIIAGAFMNFLIGWLAFSAVFMLGIPTRILIEGVLPGSPAAEAGLEAGTYVEGFNSASEFVKFVNDNQGSEITVNGRTVVPRTNPPADEGALGVVVTDVGVPKQNVLESLWRGLQSAVGVTRFIAGAFGALLGGFISGDFALADEVTGPVGVFDVLGETSKLGAAYLIQFLGLISLNLVVINLAPFPALDGGRFLFILIEKVIGRQINYRFQTAANAIGLALLLVLMAVVTIRDIMRIL